MKLNVLDASGIAQQILTPGLESSTDNSGTITATGVAQTVLASNSARSGYIIQNRGSNPMYVNEKGAATVGAGSFVIAPGDFFPPSNFPITTGAISIIGTISEIFTVREW